MRLLLDSRVVDWPRSSNLIVVTLSSLKPLFFNEYRTIETHGARFWVCRATRNRPLSAHTTKRPILAPIRAQKLNSQINVQIGDGQEVFGWSTAGNTSQSHSGYPRWVTENIGNLVN
jgi:hypothetical protein